MPYVPAECVQSPKHIWKFHRTLVDRGENGAVWCLGYWDRKPVIAYRWNGCDERPKGSPTSRGLPIWVVIEKEAYPALVPALFPDQQSEIRRFLSANMS